MSTEALAFSCGSCDHAPFDSPDKLNKHISGKHRQSSNGKYSCPKCSSSMASISGLRRHLARVCRRRSWHTSAAVQTDAPEAGPDALPEQETEATAFTLEGLSPHPFCWN
ncbi:hypothetical protein V1523DRAFT_421225 [Lipomyces doorenjongii]